MQAPPDLLRRAFAFLRDHPADLLTLIPAVDTGSVAERVFLPWATLGFLWAVDFRRTPVPGAAAHCGVGAFMLVRREAYDAVNGHAGAPMDPIDDMMLAKRVKAAGFTNRVALGGPDLHVRVYHGLDDLVRGMRKAWSSWLNWLNSSSRRNLNLAHRPHLQLTCPKLLSLEEHLHIPRRNTWCLRQNGYC